MSKRELLQINAVPIYQNKMFDSAEAALDCPSGNMLLVQDSFTGLVFNESYAPEQLCYDQSYQNEQGHSSGFRKHLNEVLEKIDQHFHGASILEVGCGKGSFLDLMRQRGHDAQGVDPAYEGEAPYIYKQPFDSSVDIKVDAVILRHVLEHIPNPLEFLGTIASANHGKGRIYIEVPCLEWIIERRAWFDIFYEHVNYFRISDFNRMFRTVHQAGYLFGGQYIYVIADLNSLRTPLNINNSESIAFPKDFFRELDKCIEMKSNAAKRVVWGAAAKGVMFSHHILKRGVSLNFAIDINPAKQQKFLAGSGLPVFSAEVGLEQLSIGDDIFVMNSNYTDEISALGGNHFNYVSVDSI